MKVGFIGAGKVGTSLGKYLVSKGLEVTGYYDTDSDAAEEASAFTGTKNFRNLETIVENSDSLFLTVSDGMIKVCWSQIKDMPLRGMRLYHCSGAMSAEEAFYGIEITGAEGYSVHPLFAVSDKFNSYKELSNSFFTIEGNTAHIDEIKALFESLGNRVFIISPEDKIKYHCAAAICSNHIVGILDEGLELMTQCGFDEESAREAMAPLILNNVRHVLETGTCAGLTGPVERCDTETIHKHIGCLKDESRQLYIQLSQKLTELAERKNPQRDYSAMEVTLKKAKYE